LTPRKAGFSNRLYISRLRGKGLNFNPQWNPLERPLKQGPGPGATRYALEGRFPDHFGTEAHSYGLRALEAPPRIRYLNMVK
jgi:hypothetical protein